MMAACGSATTGNTGPSPSPSPKYNPIYGVDFGPWTQGDAPGTAVPDKRIKAQLQALRGRTTWIKLGGATGGVENVPHLAHQMGFKVAASAFIGGHQPNDDQDILQLEKTIKAGDVDLALVGNEAVHNHYIKVPALVQLINKVRQDTAGKVPVGTVEPAQELMDNPTLVSNSDVVVANITPFSYHVPVDKALAWITDVYTKMKAASQGKEVRIGETEWPSTGGEFGKGVIASQENQALFFDQVETWARQNNVGVYYFEAFDEPWLKTADGSFGPHWGVFTSDLVLKAGMDKVFTRP